MIEQRLARIFGGSPKPHVMALWGPNGTVYGRKGRLLGWDWSTEWKTDNFLGRFGGGWNWHLGAMWDRRTIVLNLLTFSIRFEREEPDEQRAP